MNNSLCPSVHLSITHLLLTARRNLSIGHDHRPRHVGWTGHRMRVGVAMYHFLNLERGEKKQHSAAAATAARRRRSRPGAAAAATTGG